MLVTGACVACVSRACAGGDGESVGLPALGDDVSAGLIALAAALDAGDPVVTALGTRHCPECLAVAPMDGPCGVDGEWEHRVIGGVVAVGCEGFHTPALRAAALLWGGIDMTNLWAPDPVAMLRQTRNVRETHPGMSARTVLVVAWLELFRDARPEAYGNAVDLCADAVTSDEWQEAAQALELCPVHRPDATICQDDEDQECEIGQATGAGKPWPVRWNQHNNDLGTWCPWSSCFVPTRDVGNDDARCPAGCRDSHQDDESGG